MDPEMVLNAEQKQFRFRNCLKKKMLKELEQQQMKQDHGVDTTESPSDRDTPPSHFPPPPPMVPIVNSSMGTSYGTTMMSAAFSKAPMPVLVPSSTQKHDDVVSRSPYEMERRQPTEYFPEQRRDERDLKIAEVQHSYSQALDEVQIHHTLV